jgi:hypothetical protein
MKKILIIPFILFSCGGSRSVKQERLNIKTDTLSVDNSISIKQNTILKDVGKLTPFDNSKPMVINGITYYNTIIDYDKSKFNDFEIEQNENLSQGSTKLSESKKDTEKTDYTIAIIGVAIVLVGGYILYKKLPNLNK